MKQQLLLLSVIMVFASCDFIGGERVDGNGNLASESRHVSDFKNVSSSGPMDIVLTQSSTPSIQVSGDENLLQYVTTEIDDNTLKIRIKKGYNIKPEKHLQVRIAASEFHEVSLGGSGNITSENTLVNSEKMEFKLSGSGDINVKVDAPSVESETSGSGDITFSGKANDADMSVSGSGDIHCFGLTTQNTEITINGSGNAEVYATKQLSIKVNGAGDVQYKGGASVDSHINGSGSASKAD